MSEISNLDTLSPSRIDFASIARRGVRAFPGRILLSDGERHWTGATLRQHVDSLTATLQHHAPTQRVIPISCQNPADRLVAYWAAIQSGKLAYLCQDLDSLSPGALLPNDIVMVAIHDGRVVRGRVAQWRAVNTVIEIPQHVAAHDHDAAAIAHAGIDMSGEPIYATRSHRALAYTAAFGTLLPGVGAARWLIACPIAGPVLETALFAATAWGIPVRTFPGEQPSASEIAAAIQSGQITSVLATVAQTRSVLPLLKASANITDTSAKRWTIVATTDDWLEADSLLSSTGDALSGWSLKASIVDDLAGFVAFRKQQDHAWLPHASVAFAVRNANDHALEEGKGSLVIRTPQAVSGCLNPAHTGELFGSGWLKLDVSGLLDDQGFSPAPASKEAFPLQIRLPAHAQLTAKEAAVRHIGSADFAMLMQRGLKYRSESIAIRDGDITLTRRQLLERIAALSHAFVETYGLKRGDRIAYLSRNRLEFVECYWAAARIGAIFVPINFRLKSEEIDYVLRDSGASLLVSTSDLLELTSEAYLVLALGERPLDPSPYEKIINGLYESKVEDVSEDDAPTSLLYTAGTTGFPKGAIRSSKGAFWFTMIGTAPMIDGSPDAVQVMLTPMFHISGHESHMMNFMNGGSLLILREVNVETLLDTVANHNVPALFVPPAIGIDILEKLRQGDRRLDNLRYWNSASSPLPVSLRDAVKTFLPRLTFQNTLGMTESGSLARYVLPPVHAKDSSCIGKALPTNAIRIVGSDGIERGTGEVGEIIVRSPQTVSAYWNKPEQTASAFDGGWYHTGDLGMRDADGDLFILGRSKDMIISGGENVYALEVENALSRHEAVQEVAVVGVPHDRWGEAVAAFIVLRAGKYVNSSDLIAHTRSLIAHYKCPQKITFVDELPRNAMGKITKFKLKPADDPAARSSNGDEIGMRRQHSEAAP